MSSQRDWQTSLFSGQLHADRFKVRRLLDLATEGKLRIPDFQRPLRWQRTQEVDLFDSLLRRFPIGTLLLWERPATAARLQFKELVVHAPELGTAFWIVDGQQRINTLVGTLLRPEGEPSIRSSEMFFDLERGLFLWRKEPEDSRFIPVRRLRSSVEVSRWARASSSTDRVHDLAVQLSTAILDYEVPAYTTNVQDDAILREVFTRVNTRGTAMRETEVFYAINRSTSPRSFDHALADVALGLGFGVLPEGTRMKILQAVSGISPRSGAVLAQQRADTFLATVPAAATALQRAILFLRDEAEIPHINLLPGHLPLVALGHLFHRFPEVCERSVELLDRWVWRSAAVGDLSLTNEHLNRAFRAIEDATHEEDAVQLLLHEAPRVAPQQLPRPVRVNRRGNTTRLALLWLRSLEPRVFSQVESLVTHPFHETPDEGDDVTSAEAEPDDAAEPLEWLRLPCASEEARRSIGSVLLHAPTSPSDLRRLAGESNALLRSHALEEEDRDAIRDGRWDEVVLRRQTRIEAGVTSMIRRHCAWGVDDDGPSITHTALGEDHA